MATTSRIEERKEAVERKLQMKMQHIEGHLDALQDEVTTLGPAVGKAIFEHPLVSVGGMLVAGLAVGLLLGGRRRSPAVAERRRALVERYIDALVAETRYRVARGQDADAAVRDALEDHTPLIVYETPEDERPRRRQNVPRQAVDILLKTLLGMTVKVGIDAVTARFGGFGDSDTIKSSVSTAAVSEALDG